MEQHLDTLVAEREQREREQKRRDRETHMAAAGWRDAHASAALGPASAQGEHAPSPPSIKKSRTKENIPEHNSIGINKNHIALPRFNKRLLSNKEPMNLCD